MEPTRKRGPTVTEDNVKTEIKNIAKDGNLFIEQRVRRIMALGNPLPLADTKKIEFYNNKEIWDRLKTEGDFWIGISRLLGIPDYTALDENDRAIFGVEDIYRIMGAVWWDELLLLTHLDDQPLDIQQRLARSVFVQYVNWFDSEANIQFLVLYAYYLRIQNQLVPIAMTKQHKNAPAPRFKQTSVPVPNIPQPTKPTVEEAAITLNLDSDLFYVITTMTIAMSNESLEFTLSMRKKANEDDPFIFNIFLRGEERGIITKGAITRVLKFVYKDSLYVVISGESDSTLIRIRYTKDGFPISTDVNFPPLNADLFDDLVYHNTKYFRIVAINMKSVTSLANLRLLDLRVFGGLRDVPVTKIGELPAFEKKIYTRQQLRETGALGNERPLTDVERAALISFRRIKDRGPVPADIKIGQLENDELDYIRRATGFITLVPSETVVLSSQRVEKYNPLKHKTLLTGSYSTLFINLVAPIVPLFKSGQQIYRTNDTQLLAAKVVATPGDIVNDTFIVAILAREYTSDKTSILVLYLYQYNGGTGQYKAIKHRQFNLTDFIIDSIEVKEFNLIFHTEIFFYVEVLQGERIHTSQILQFDFHGFNVLVGRSPEKMIKDYTIVNTLAQHGYKIYDFRHHNTVNHTIKFSAIYLKYNPATNDARIIVYKARDTGPSVADRYFKGLKISSILGISPMEAANNLAHIQIRYKNVPTMFRIMGKQDLSPYTEKFSLAHQFQRTLSLSGHEKLGIEERPFCVFCGEYTNELDKVTGYHYCDKLCQLLFCTTKEL